MTDSRLFSRPPAHPPTRVFLGVSPRPTPKARCIGTLEIPMREPYDVSQVDSQPPGLSSSACDGPGQAPSLLESVLSHSPSADPAASSLKLAGSGAGCYICVPEAPSGRLDLLVVSGFGGRSYLGHSARGGGAPPDAVWRGSSRPLSNSPPQTGERINLSPQRGKPLPQGWRRNRCQQNTCDFGLVVSFACFEL